VLEALYIAIEGFFAFKASNPSIFPETNLSFSQLSICEHQRTDEARLQLIIVAIPTFAVGFWFCRWSPGKQGAASATLQWQT
jgi:hypothetical protein